VRIHLRRKPGNGIGLSKHLDNTNFHHACATNLDEIIAKRRDPTLGWGPSSTL
jgi:hypothetical protein